MGILVLLDLLLVRVPTALATGSGLGEGAYSLTDPVAQAIGGDRYLLLAALLALAGFGATLATRLSALWIGACPVLGYLLLVLVEGVRDRSSHNLLPLELAIVGIAMAPQGLAALLLRAMGVGRLPPRTKRER